VLCQGVLGGWDDPNPKGWMIFMEKRRKMMEDVDKLWENHGGNDDHWEKLYGNHAQKYGK